MVVNCIPNPVEGAKLKVSRHWTGPMESNLAKSMLSCDQNGPLVVQVTKLFNSQDAMSFNSFGRVLSGTAKPGQQVRVLGELYTPDDEEDSTVATIGDTWLSESRYNVPIVSGVPAGNWVSK